MGPAPLIRIGELARRAGIPAATLRAWERRYGIVEPKRTEAGYRLYSEEDERRLAAMVEMIAAGAAPAEAAAKVNAAESEAAADGNGDVSVGAEALRAELMDALGAFDELAAHRALDRGIAAYSTEALLAEVVIPALRETESRWREGAISVGQEHFASNLIRGRLLALARGWGGGEGPLALLACPPGEAHDIGLICIGLLLRQRGWRITFLGADTPLETIAVAARRTEPEVIVLPAASPESVERLGEAAPLDLGAPVLIGGAGASTELAEALGARLLGGDIVAAAAAIAGGEG